jgi:anthranilate/para-aminobenzoate synthase component I
VHEVGRKIAAGEIYQANLCQRFQVGYRGDALALFDEISHEHDAPHAAFYETPRFSLLSVSPEAFLRMSDARTVSTWPIKGTRPRGADARADRLAARELEDSPKDRAELVMIVDLERNDLSRVCSAGSVRVVAPPHLRSFSSVHHLVAGIQGQLRAGIEIDDLIRATFPGGSITGAPKIRAMQLLRQLEPVPRGFFTGSLCWFGDDGRFDSSILIRSLVLEGATAYLGAGGGIVADSDAEEEWRESNHKARFLTRALGFEPEEAL